MSYSTSTERGIELAKDMVNDRGGLLGKPVQLVSVDNHGKPEDAVAAIQQLTVRHVSAIIGRTWPIVRGLSSPTWKP